MSNTAKNIIIVVLFICSISQTIFINWAGNEVDTIHKLAHKAYSIQDSTISAQDDTIKVLKFKLQTLTSND